MRSKKDQSIIREHPVTYDEYAKLPDDGNRYEIAGGVLELMSPAPAPKHQVICFQLQSNLTRSCQSDFIIIASPVDLILSPTEVRQPDLLMVRRTRMEIITRRGIEGIPDLVVEILSPSSAKRDRLSKLVAYAKYKIPEYWIVDPANEVLEQYLLSVGNEFKLHAVYGRNDTVLSERIPCASFIMGEIVDAAADLPG